MAEFLGNTEEIEMYCPECEYYVPIYEEYKYSTSQHGALVTLQYCCSTCGYAIKDRMVDKDI